MNVDYLRVSITDRCNVRCIYCSPLGGDALIGRREILSFEEIHRVVGLCAECGIKTVRLTGGEPLVRKDVVDLVRKLARVPGIEELTMTTNGVLLEPLAAELKEAGLKRVNVSLCAAEAQCYRRITGLDLFAAVISSIHKALEVGLSPVKINTVVIKDINVGQIPALVEMTFELPVFVRFIEYCPTSRHTWPTSGYVPNSEVRRMIESRFGRLSSIVVPQASGPAVYFKVAGSMGAIGLISGSSSVFCQRCNRLRLTSDGRITPCLYSDRYYDLRQLIRSGADDRAVAGLIRQIIGEKYRHTKLTAQAADFSMQNIGG